MCVPPSSPLADKQAHESQPRGAEQRWLWQQIMDKPPDLDTTAPTGQKCKAYNSELKKSKQKTGIYHRLICKTLLLGETQGPCPALSGHYSREWSECIHVKGVNE